MKDFKNKAFTLVELIVVIIILAILGTIAFISLQGYSASSRDSVRISDISSMRTSIELFQLNTGKYPQATDGFTVTYSGWEVWNQGIFWESVFINVEALDKIPTDPLTDKQYTYSVTTTRQEYEFAGIMETDDISFVQDTFAADTEATALVTWNYNWAVMKTLSGSNCEVLSLPSIISNQEETTTDLVDILSSEWLVYHWHKNLPTSYRNTKYKADGWFAFTSQKLVVYSDTDSCTPLTELTQISTNLRAQMVKNLQEAYSGTLIQNDSKIIKYTSLDTNDVEKLNLLWWTVVNNNIGWELNLKKINTFAASCASNPWYTNANFVEGTPTSIWVAWQNSNPLNPCYYSCTNNYTGSDCSVAPGCAANPWYTHASFVEWSPTWPNTAWQNSNAGNPCYFSCTDSYTWPSCQCGPWSSWTGSACVWYPSDNTSNVSVTYVRPCQWWSGNGTYTNGHKYWYIYGSWINGSWWSPVWINPVSVVFNYVSPVKNTHVFIRSHSNALEYSNDYAVEVSDNWSTWTRVWETHGGSYNNGVDLDYHLWYDWVHKYWKVMYLESISNQTSSCWYGQYYIGTYLYANNS